MSRRRQAGNSGTLLLAASILLPLVLFGATAWFDRVLMVQQGRQQILASASAPGISPLRAWASASATRSAGARGSAATASR